MESSHVEMVKYEYINIERQLVEIACWEIQNWSSIDKKLLFLR